MAFCLEYGFFKVFKCHESATVCPIRGAIAGSKHETPPILCHAGLMLPILVTNPKGNINQLSVIVGLGEKYWMLIHCHF